MSFSERLGGVIDRLAYAINPVWGARRQMARAHWEANSQRMLDLATYESAESTHTRQSSWISSRLSADAALEQDLEGMRVNSRELYRTDSMGGPIDQRATHVVGTGFKAQSRIKDVPNAETINQQLEDLLEDWQLSVDTTGKRSLWQITKLAERVHATDGEALVVMSDVGAADKPIPLTLEVVDVDRLETPPQHLSDKRHRMGIEYNAQGRIVAYWIRRSHPNDNKDFSVEYDRVPAARVCHIFEAHFAGQSRGLPWMQRVLNRIRDAKDLDEASIIKAQIEACFAAFVQNEGGSLAAATGAATGTTANGKRLQEISPGMIHYLERNQSVSFGNPSSPGNSYSPFQEWNYRRVAAGMNWPYEFVASNWQGVSFAGGRLALASAHEECKSWRKLLTEMLLAPVWNRLVEECVILGLADIDPRRYSENPRIYQRHCWIGPGWPYAVNPTEDVKASILKLQADLVTHDDLAAEGGYDGEELRKKRKEEREEMGVPDPNDPAEPSPQPVNEEMSAWQ